jgi:hypothetical protein
MSNPTDWRALCAIAVELWDADCDMESVISQMRTALSQSEPEGPTLDCDEIDIPAWYRGDDVHVYEEGYTAGWAAGTQAMAHHAHPAIQPEPGAS